MSKIFAPRRLIMIVSLMFIWCGLWGEVTPANLVSGFAVAVAIAVIGVGTPGKGGIRPLLLLRLFGLVLVDLAMSTFYVAIEIVRLDDRTDEAIVAVEVPLPSRDHLLLLVVSVTLTPGTAVVGADPDTGTLYLHLLHDKRRDATITHVQRLARLACVALPVRHTERAGT